MLNDFYIPLLGFGICASIILYSGAKLSFYGDKIADLTNMGKAWTGLILMASVTSLPELITGISSVTIVNAPDLAAGDIFGSCVFNLFILSILDIRIKQPLCSMVQSNHIVSAIFGIILLAVSGIAILLSKAIPVILGISYFSFVLFGIYLVSVWSIFKYGRISLLGGQPPPPINQIPPDTINLKKAIRGYTMHAIIVIGAAVFLPYFGQRIALYTGLGNSFFGTLFIAAATSLPELVVSFSALKMGSLDIAVGNLLGSNVFNMFILSIDDIFYTEGSLFHNVSISHLLSVLITIIMTSVVSLGLLFRPKRKQMWLLSFDAFIIIFLYMALIIYLFIKNSYA